MGSTLLKGRLFEDSIGDFYIGVIEGDARSLDYSSYVNFPKYRDPNIEPKML